MIFGEFWAFLPDFLLILRLISENYLVRADKDLDWQKNTEYQYTIDVLALGKPWYEKKRLKKVTLPLNG